MSKDIIISLITALPTLIVAIISVVQTNKLTIYKIEQLEKKVEKHNNFMERVAILERDNKTVFNRVDELREDIKDIESKVSA